MDMKAPSGQAGNQVFYRDGSTGQVDANGFLNVPAAFVNDMQTAGFTPVLPSATGAVPAITAITTVGAGVLAAAALVGGIVNRSGSVAAFSDATDTAANIFAAAVGVPLGYAFNADITNLTAFPMTITGGTGVTVNGIAVIPPLSVLRARVLDVSATACTFTGVGIYAISLPLQAQYATDDGTTKTLAAAKMAGAEMVYLASAGGTTPTLTTDTGPNIIAAIPNAKVGQTYMMRLINSNSGNLTFAANATGVTLTGGTTLATVTWADYVVTIATATTVTLQYVGKGTV